jgi:hypothetical protein
LNILASGSSPAAGQVVTGVLAFLVVAGMGVALFFLLRSMNKQLRKVMREPPWREEPGQGTGGPQDQPEGDYSRNGTGQA